MLKTKIGFLPSNWDAWDGPLKDGSRWALQMRNRCVKVLETVPGLELVAPSPALTGDGCVSDLQSARRTLELFRNENIQGLFVGNMTFGMEVAVSEVLRGLPQDIPILHFCTRSGPIEDGPWGGHRTTDTWCGQFMTTSALRRRGFRFLHVRTCNPEEPLFFQKVETFVRAVAAISNFRGARFGQLGNRPALFESQVVNEQLLQRRFRQTIVPMDLDAVFARIDAVSPGDPRVREILAEITRGVEMRDQTEEALTNIARYEVALRGIAEELDVRALSASCWTGVQERFHISACSTFGRLNDGGLMTACEVDMGGALTMWAMYNAGLRETAPDFIDWTDLHPAEPNVWLAWHCGNAAPSLKQPCSRVLFDRNERMIQWCPTCFGTLEFRLKSGPVTCARLVEYDGEFRMFIGSGEVVDTPPEIRGAFGWVKVADVGDWEEKMIEAGIIHHGVLIHDAKVADALEMFCYFLGIKAYRGA